MKTYLILITYLFFVIHPFNAQNKNSGIVLKYDTADIRKKQSQLALEAESKLGKDQILLPELLKSFDYKPTANTKSGWYHHKVKKDTNQSWLEAPVSVDGHIYLKARYTGSELYNMVGVSVKCGRLETYSSPLAINSNYAYRKKVGNKITEVLHLFAYKKKKGYDIRNLNCIESIASANDNDEITIKFRGEKEYFYHKITKENIKAIKQSWQLSQLICYKNKNYYCETFYWPSSDLAPYVIFYPKTDYTVDDMKGLVKF